MAAQVDDLDGLSEEKLKELVTQTRATLQATHERSLRRKETIKKLQAEAATATAAAIATPTKAKRPSTGPPPTYRSPAKRAKTLHSPLTTKFEMTTRTPQPIKHNLPSAVAEKPAEEEKHGEEGADPDEDVEIVDEWGEWVGENIMDIILPAISEGNTIEQALQLAQTRVWSNYEGVEAESMQMFVQTTQSVLEYIKTQVNWRKSNTSWLWRTK